MSPRKEVLKDGGPSGPEILSALTKRYSRDELPPIVWRVAEADAVAEVVEPQGTDSIVDAAFGDYDPKRYVVLATADDLGIDDRALSKIRRFAEEAYGILAADTDRLTAARTALYERLGLSAPTASPQGPADTSQRSASTRPTRSTGDAAESDWEWNPSEPFESGQIWGRALMRCEHVSATPKLLGLAMREVADTRKGTVHFGTKMAEAILGMNERKLKEHRPKLVKAGWITDTGRETMYGLSIYRLTVPRCCEGRGTENPYLIVDDG